MSEREVQASGEADTARKQRRFAVRFDRDRVIAFWRFLWQRFLDDKCFETAGALAYTTLFALVPLTAAVFSILAALPVFSDWTEKLTDFVFRNFVPAAGEAVQKYVLEFAGNASKLTGIGVVVLLVTALLMMSSIEERFNRIWRVSARRSTLSRFLMYWAVLTMGPILVGAGLTLTTYVDAVPLLNRASDTLQLRHHLLGMLPFLVSLVALVSLYKLVPNRRVLWRHAATGGLLAAVLFEIAKWAFASYVRSVPSYQQIYGALAVVPIFLVWIYLSWVVVLLGASVAASLSSFDYRPASDRLPVGAEFLGLLHVVKHFVAAQQRGAGLDEDVLHQCERFVSDDLLQRYLHDLQVAGLIQRTDGEDWVMVRSLDSVSLADLYESGQYRLPSDEALIRRHGEGLPAPLLALLARMGADLGGSLEVALGDIFRSPGTPARAARSPAAVEDPT